MAEPMSDERFRRLWKETDWGIHLPEAMELAAEIERLREQSKTMASQIALQYESEVARWKHILGTLDPEGDAGEYCEHVKARLAAADKLIEGWDLSHKNVACLHDPPRKCVCGLNQARNAYWKLKEPNSNTGES